ncbi:DUF6694 family lipoprotein [Arthrospiribacter ruber]|uniref:Uncharacterized protein n=1 Tax=Arthrospiribacter ruber TaxID=2487934 RepID=A0A951MAJ1_9BACT|nr:DUF6694 family lipoprotein [Arthrospiribacter ruber]MBW3466644.1 hypothetical protein [Arthrospiribacter ruber]
MKNYLVYSLICMLLLTSCSKKIDATNERTLHLSVQKMSASMNEDQQEEFMDALQTVGFHYLFEGEDAMFKALHKKTAKQIIQYAKKIEEEDEVELFASSQRLDATDMHTLIGSIEASSKKLSWSERNDFENALQFMQQTYMYNESESRFLRRFHNKTPGEIINEANKIAGNSPMKSSRSAIWDIPNKEKKATVKKKPWE